jgi:hypothetical protein
VCCAALCRVELDFTPDLPELPFPFPVTKPI